MSEETKLVLPNMADDDNWAEGGGLPSNFNATIVKAYYTDDPYRGHAKKDDGSLLRILGAVFEIHYSDPNLQDLADEKDDMRFLMWSMGNKALEFGWRPANFASGATPTMADVCNLEASDLEAHKGTRLVNVLGNVKMPKNSSMEELWSHLKKSESFPKNFKDALAVHDLNPFVGEEFAFVRVPQRERKGLPSTTKSKKADQREFIKEIVIFDSYVGKGTITASSGRATVASVDAETAAAVAALIPADGITKDALCRVVMESLPTDKANAVLSAMSGAFWSAPTLWDLRDDKAYPKAA